jgi:hypothetical protein
VSDAEDPDHLEERLLLQWWQTSATQGIPGPGAGSKLATPRIVQTALDALSGSRFFVGLAERALIFDLKQVRLYLTKPETRAEIQHRVAGCIGEDTRVLVAHSLGSVVAYELLCAHPEWPVRTLVTLGSPWAFGTSSSTSSGPPLRAMAWAYGPAWSSTGRTSRTRLTLLRS